MAITPPPQMVTVKKWMETTDSFRLIFNQIQSPFNLKAAFIPYDSEETTAFEVAWIELVKDTFENLYETMKLVPLYDFADSTKNATAVIKMMNEIRLRSISLLHKYSLLAETLPPISEALNEEDMKAYLEFIVSNYKVHTENEYESWLGEVENETDGSITHSRDYLATHNVSNDSTVNNYMANDQTSEPKWVSKTETDANLTTTNTENNESDDEITTYDEYKVTTRQKYNENDTSNLSGKKFKQNKVGFYNSGSMSKILTDIRQYADFNILEQYVKDVTAHITAYYA